MFKIDSENMTIYLTRGDSASIIFSAKSDEGEQFHPTKNDRLYFSAAKKHGEEPLIEIMNVMDDDESEFWTINLETEHTKHLNFSKYAFDVEIEMRDSVTDELTGVKTIIGKTDEITPYLVLWGEVSPEGE